MYPAAALTGREYYFSTGSTEAFKRKLDKAQKEIGIPSHERIFVAHCDEISTLGMALHSSGGAEQPFVQREGFTYSFWLTA